MGCRSHVNPIVFKASNPFEAEESNSSTKISKGQNVHSVTSHSSCSLPTTVPNRSPVGGSGAAETNARDVEQRMQKVTQATLSTNGQYLRLPSGHEIHPYLLAWVIEAVRQVVQASRIHTAH